MNTLMQINQVAELLSPAQQIELLHFVEFLKQRSHQTIIPQRNWQTVFQITQQFSDDFMEDGRSQPEMQIRETF